MKLASKTRRLIELLRDCVRAEDGTCKDLVQTLSRLPDFQDSTVTSGFFVTRNGRIEDGHIWLVMPDMTIVDPWQDAFGEEGFGDVVSASEKDPKAQHYFPYTGEPGIPMEVLNSADKAQARVRTQKNRRSFREMIEDTGPSIDPNPYRDSWESLDDVLEDWGGRPVGDPNAQQADTMPDYLTVGGHEGVPQEEEDKEFKPEEFGELLHRMELDNNGSPSEVDHVGEDPTMLNMDDLSDTIDDDELSLSDLEDDDDLKEVDHPEFMPGGEESPRYDPEVDLGRAGQRNPTYNRGHPEP